MPRSELAADGFLSGRGGQRTPVPFIDAIRNKADAGVDQHEIHSTRMGAAGEVAPGAPPFLSGRLARREVQEIAAVAAAIGKADKVRRIVVHVEAACAKVEDAPRVLSRDSANFADGGSFRRAVDELRHPTALVLHERAEASKRRIGAVAIRQLIGSCSCQIIGSNITGERQCAPRITRIQVSK